MNAIVLDGHQVSKAYFLKLINMENIYYITSFTSSNQSWIRRKKLFLMHLTFGWVLFLTFNHNPKIQYTDFNIIIEYVP